MLRWSVDGEEPDFFIVMIVGGDKLPAWRQVVPGSLRESPIPDFSRVSGLKDIAEGSIEWAVRAVRVEDFEYNRFQYNLMLPSYWTHQALDIYQMRR